MSAGPRNKFLTIQRPTANPTFDTTGQQQVGFELACTQWGKVVTKGSPLWQRLGITRAEVSHVLTVPNCVATRAITPAYRVILDGDYLEVLAAYDPTSSGETIQIEARSSAN